jgi:hypothetical protein
VSRKSLLMIIKTTRFGWCGSGHHKECRVSFVDWNKNEIRCSCECHVDKDEKDGTVEV